MDRRDISRARSTPLSEEQEKELLEKLEEGYPISRISKEYKIGHQRLYAIAEAAGLSPKRGPRKGPDHTWWKGGRTVGGNKNYISIWVPDDHPYACMRNHKRRVQEHRLVMAEHLGRPLLPQETVHHINGRKDDNRIENLQLMASSHGRRMAYRCTVCGSMSVEAVALPA